MQRFLIVCAIVIEAYIIIYCVRHFRNRSEINGQVDVMQQERIAEHR